MRLRAHHIVTTGWPVRQGRRVVLQRAGIDIGGSWRGDREVPLFLTSAKKPLAVAVVTLPRRRNPRLPLRTLPIHSVSLDASDGERNARARERARL